MHWVTLKWLIAPPPPHNRKSRHQQLLLRDDGLESPCRVHSHTSPIPGYYPLTKDLIHLPFIRCLTFTLPLPYTIYPCPYPYPIPYTVCLTLTLTLKCHCGHVTLPLSLIGHTTAIHACDWLATTQLLHNHPLSLQTPSPPPPPFIPVNSVAHARVCQVFNCARA